MSSEERQKQLKVKKKIDKKRPRFVKPESWRYVRIHPSWRRPRGIDNRVRRGKKGWPPSPNTGYRSPKAVRSLHPSGMEEVLVYNVGDLAIIDPETQVARIGGSVGGKKRIAIVDEALKREIRVLNPGKGRPVLELEEEEELPEEENEEPIAKEEEEDTAEEEEEMEAEET